MAAYPIQAAFTLSTGAAKVRLVENVVHGNKKASQKIRLQTMCNFTKSTAKEDDVEATNNKIPVHFR